MKITKEQLKKILKEEYTRAMSEIEAPVALEEAGDSTAPMLALKGTMEELVDQLKELDLSIDYLSSIFIGTDPLNVGAQQTGYGRAARPFERTKRRRDEE
tara:strand:+ start:136 stop:435 length:300 start_codon:yes stop_codon:yes gene_type:complete